MFGLRHSLTANEQRGLDRHGEPEPTNLRPEAQAPARTTQRHAAPSRVLRLACRLNFCAFSDSPTTVWLIWWPSLLSSVASRRRLLQVQRSDDMGLPRASGSTSAFRSSSSWGSVSVNDLRPPPGRRTRPAASESSTSMSFGRVRSCSQRSRHTRHRGDAAVSRGLGFRRSEKPPLPFVEMRQHRRVALLEKIFIDHPQELRRATPA